jgi:hypothetical protein
VVAAQAAPAIASHAAEAIDSEAARYGRPGLVPIGLGTLVPKDAATQHKTALELRPMAPRPLLPGSGLRTIAEAGAESLEPTSATPLWKRAWGPVIQHSRALRSGYVWTGLAACLLLAFFLRSPRETERLAEDVQAVQGFRTVLAGHWESLQESVSHRAAVSLADDFRAGLGRWEGDGEWADSWSYDAAGFVRPGNLAIYKPSIPLVDYDFSFAGQVEADGLSWVARASNTNNYYAIRLAITEPGPLPRATIVRYPVVDGRRGPTTRTEVPFTLRNQQMHDIRTDVHDDDFTVYVNGQLVDYWSEPRLPVGGVGFFRSGRERSRLRWLNVTHQYDLLGRLCALVAPYNFDQAARSIEP